MKKLAVAILVVVTGGVLTQFILNSLPKTVPANVLITQAGRYRSPNGQHEVNIWREKDGRLKYFFSLAKPNFSIAKPNDLGSGPTKSFAKDSNWFMCWNSQGELWTYVAEHDLTHCNCLYVRGNVVGNRRAGELGGWEGIPDTFKAKLPVDIQEMCAAASVVKAP